MRCRRVPSSSALLFEYVNEMNLLHKYRRACLERIVRVYLNLYQESTTSAEETLLKSAGAR